MDGWTTPIVIAGAAALLAVLVAFALAVALVRTRRSTQRQLDRSHELQEELLLRLSALEQPVPTARPAGGVAEFVITEVGTQSGTEPGTEPVADAGVGPEAPTRIEGRLFADVVLRESVVKAASWTHGVRTALTAENRNRIRFEMKRETKRSSKQRKADAKEALRQYYARQDAARAQEDLA